MKQCKLNLIVIVFDSNTLGYIPFRDLKRVRHVSKLWSEVAFNLIKKRVIVDMHFSSCDDHGDRSMQPFRYCYDMKNNRMTNWRLYMPFIGIDEDEDRGGQGAKLTSDLDWFLQFTHIVNTLQYRGSICSHYDLSVFIKILDKLKDTLQELDVASYCKLTWKQDSGLEQFPRTPLRLTKLRKVTLHLISDTEFNLPEDITTINNWVQPFIAAITAVKSIHIKSSKDLAALVIQVSITTQH